MEKIIEQRDGKKIRRKTYPIFSELERSSNGICKLGYKT